MSLLRRCGADTKGAPAGVADTLLFAFRHFPLAEVHPYATHAAESAEAAGAQGKFWQMHDYLFQHQAASRTATWSKRLLRLAAT
jgi:protein-disulfide isomerase